VKSTRQVRQLIGQLLNQLTLSADLLDVSEDLRWAFQWPLRDLVRSRLGIPAAVSPSLPLDEIKCQPSRGKVVSYPVDLGKSARLQAPGTHLVTVYGYDPGTTGSHCTTAHRRSWPPPRRPAYLPTI
jgi:hypothetical protein